MFLRPRLDPHRVRAAQQQRIGFGIRHDPAGGGDHGRLVLVDDAFEASALVAAEGCKSSHLDQIGNARPVVLLDEPVELDKRAAERIGKTAAQRRFAGAAQPNERDPTPTIDLHVLRSAALDQLGKRGKFCNRHAGENIEDFGHRQRAPVAAREQFNDGDVEGARDRFEDDDRRVALPAFDLREVALGGARGVCELPARHAALGAGEPQQAADGTSERAMIDALRRRRRLSPVHFRLGHRRNLDPPG